MAKPTIERVSGIELAFGEGLAWDGELGRGNAQRERHPAQGHQLEALVLAPAEAVNRLHPDAGCRGPSRCAQEGRCGCCHDCSPGLQARSPTGPASGARVLGPGCSVLRWSPPLRARPIPSLAARHSPKDKDENALARAAEPASEQRPLPLEAQPTWGSHGPR